jgi:predicted outer membrane repeat protein
MAGSSRRYTLAAFAVPFLFLAMSGLARANTIIVNTLDGGSQYKLCTLQDAVVAAETQAPVHGCAGGSGDNDTIQFVVAGTIYLSNTLVMTNDEETLTIVGPAAGITIDGQFDFELVDVENDSTVNLKNLTLTEGSDPQGGALFSGGATVNIADCSFIDNESAQGGAIFAGGSTVVIVNSTFNGNYAEEQGGGIYNDESEVSVTNATFSGNEAAVVDAGAVPAGPPESNGACIASHYATTDVKSSIFGDSVSGGNCDGVTDEGYNLSDDATCGFSGTSENSVTNLKLYPLALNGGPTETMALGYGSKAINFIPIASCVDSNDDPVTTDQRGFGRPSPNNLDFCDAGAYEAGAVAPFVVVPGSLRLQIVHGSGYHSDQVNTAFTFTENGVPTCNLENQDALNDGFDLTLYEGECGGNLTGGLSLSLTPFVVHTVNHQSYGTLFQSMPPETVSARMLALPAPEPPACGEWTLNLEVAGLNTNSLNLGGTNPFALVLTTVDGTYSECFDVTNAIVGGHITQPSETVRRGVRR